MQKSKAALLSGAFYIAAPGTVVGLIPWLITRWRFRRPLPGWGAARVTGAVLIAAGLVPATSAFAEFVKAEGTPIPAAPTERLVVTGFNRYVRNPMYVGLLLAILGQALLFGNFRLLIYAAAAATAPAAFVHWYEEPTLARRFGAEYEEYRRAVPAFRPRLRPWTPEPAERTHA
ncbi:methyltransferase family protein [Sciscionella sediminilitoris]|uniref:methyltransferase family protein n=1 Tax=Sciscionella sediminilitoris TaxID=1445613 RepID=UPI0004DFBDE8|nr:isoprenylcysteine carboxylmethyltransferase family protein [Sciscionella sp. SE31]